MADLPIITCDNCGACCMHIGWPPFGEYERPYVPEELLAEADEAETRLRALGDPDVPCIWFDTEAKRCRHYEDRPDMCERFEVGGDWCLDWRKERGIDA